MWSVKPPTVYGGYVHINSRALAIAYGSWNSCLQIFLRSFGMSLHMKEVGFTCVSFAPLSWNHKQFYPLISQEGLYLTYQRSTVQSPNDYVVFNPSHRAYDVYSVCRSYLPLLKIDLLSHYIHLSWFWRSLAIMSHGRKVVKRLMLWKELINGLEALCYHRSLRPHYSMITGQRKDRVSSSYYTHEDSAHFNQGPSHLFVSRLN